MDWMPQKTSGFFADGRRKFRIKPAYINHSASAIFSALITHLTTMHIVHRVDDDVCPMTVHVRTYSQGKYVRYSMEIGTMNDDPVVIMSHPTYITTGSKMSCLRAQFDLINDFGYCENVALPKILMRGNMNEKTRIDQTWIDLVKSKSPNEQLIGAEFLAHESHQQLELGFRSTAMYAEYLPVLLEIHETYCSGVDRYTELSKVITGSLTIFIINILRSCTPDLKMFKKFKETLVMAILLETCSRDEETGTVWDENIVEYIRALSAIIEKWDKIHDQQHEEKVSVDNLVNCTERSLLQCVSETNDPSQKSLNVVCQLEATCMFNHRSMNTFWWHNDQLTGK